MVQWAKNEHKIHDTVEKGFLRYKILADNKISTGLCLNLAHSPTEKYRQAGRQKILADAEAEAQAIVAVSRHFPAYGSLRSWLPMRPPISPVWYSTWTVWQEAEFFE
jgi:hypothetical protein